MVSLVGTLGLYLRFPQAGGGVEGAQPRHLISSNDETAGGHFQAGSKLSGVSRLELWGTEMNETAAILTVRSELMGRLHLANAVISLTLPSGAEAQSGIR